jgi:hypothetical protein
MDNVENCKRYINISSSQTYNWEESSVCLGLAHSVQSSDRSILI